MSSKIGVRAYFGLDCDDAEAAEAYIRYNLMPEVEGELGKIVKS